MKNKATPRPWKLRSMGDDCFIEARIPGKPYGQEIMGDDYFPELSRRGDAEFILAAVEAYDAGTAAGAWSKKYPSKPGQYLVQFEADSFPKGDPNNTTHMLVYVCREEGKLVVLRNGSMTGPEDCAGWLWAKVNIFHA